jgi:ABC-2 type transport system ATP-binding protein
VIVLSKGRIVADAGPAELINLMKLSNLESVFAQLVEQTETERMAQQVVEVMKVRHA